MHGLPRFAALVSILAALVVSAPLATACAQGGARFVPVPEGTLDTETGLIWGFSFYQTDEYLRDIGIHEGGGTWHTWLGATNMSLNHYDRETEEPLPDGFANYVEFSNWYSGESNADWRLPTRDEVLAALDAGLYEAYDSSPHEGFQLADSYGEYWTSTTTKVQGKTKGYCIALGTRNIELFSLGTPARALAVRGRAAEPPEEPSKGNGKK